MAKNLVSNNPIRISPSERYQRDPPAVAVRHDVQECRVQKERMRSQWLHSLGGTRWVLRHGLPMELPVSIFGRSFRIRPGADFWHGCTPHGEGPGKSARRTIAIGVRLAGKDVKDEEDDPSDERQQQPKKGPSAPANIVETAKS